MYGHTGHVVTTSFPSDYYAHIETDYGSFSVTCNTTSNSVDCTEGTGIYRRLVLDDGSTSPLGGPVFTFNLRLEDIGHDDPLGDLANSGLRGVQDPHDPKIFHYPVKSFPYRTVRRSSGFDGICVPYDVTDKKGRPKQREACYLISRTGH